MHDNVVQMLKNQSQVLAEHFVAPYVQPHNNPTLSLILLLYQVDYNYYKLLHQYMQIQPQRIYKLICDQDNPRLIKDFFCQNIIYLNKYHILCMQFSSKLKKLISHH
ncbi:unnamed protein product [Paramecium primaurelia]|uniref:Uncharacterized protein n=1 Tax=Paramecium primaurelia TaxID=5886 RepID=A0A8S1KVG6_PARPR|nr:unnamed protein product [Paramecium primaurelia]